MFDEKVEKELTRLRTKYAVYMDDHTIVFGQQLDKLQQGDFDYDSPQTAETETLGHYAEQLRLGL